MRRILLLTVTLALAGCATPVTHAPVGTQAEIAAETVNQQQMVLEENNAATSRVMTIAYNIMRNSRDFCPAQRMETGFVPWSLEQYSSNYRTVPNGRIPRVQLTVPNTPAAKAGVKARDMIVAAGGIAIHSMDDLNQYMDAHKNDPKLALTLERNGQIKDVTLNRNATCDFDVVYLPDEEDINAYADGKTIYIPRGMANFLKTDNDLAVIIGHEIGHNVMTHRDKKLTNTLGAGSAGMVLDLLALAGGFDTQGQFTKSFMQVGGKIYSVDFEQEADYVGLYLARRGGYSINNAADVWRRWGVKEEDMITERSTHPTSPERFVALNKTIKEIQAKQASGQPLRPNMEPPTLSAAAGKTKAGFN